MEKLKPIKGKTVCHNQITKELPSIDKKDWLIKPIMTTKNEISLKI